MDYYKIGNYITQLRKSKSLTQEQLAEKIGVSPKTISKWENGINIPETLYVYKLSKEFGVTIQDILNGEKINNVIDNNSIVFKSLSFYNNVFKKKYIRLFVTLIIIIGILFSIAYTMFNFNQNKVFDLSSATDDYYISGYLIYNPKEALFFMNNFSYTGTLLGTEYEPRIQHYRLFIKTKNNDLVLYNKEEVFDNEYNLTDFLYNISISFIVNKEIFNSLNEKSINNIYIQLLCFDSNENEKEVIINLKKTKHYSNSQITY